MCGFVGFVNFKRDISKDKKIPDEEGYYIDKSVALAHKRLIVIDPEGRKTTYARKIFFWYICYCL